MMFLSSHHTLISKYFSGITPVLNSLDSEKALLCKRPDLGLRPSADDKINRY